MLSTALEKAVDRAYHSAQSANHEFLTLEHLLLALLDERSVVDALLTDRKSTRLNSSHW